MEGPMRGSMEGSMGGLEHIEHDRSGKVRVAQ